MEPRRSAETPNSLRDLKDIFFFLPLLSEAVSTFKEHWRWQEGGRNPSQAKASLHRPGKITKQKKNQHKSECLPPSGLDGETAGTSGGTALVRWLSCGATSPSAHWRWYRVTYSFFTNSRGTITYCSPFPTYTHTHHRPEKTIQRSPAAQRAKSEGCFRTRRGPRLLQPHDWWVTPFVQFCQWRSWRHFAKGLKVRSCCGKRQKASTLRLKKKKIKGTRVRADSNQLPLNAEIKAKAYHLFKPSALTVPLHHGITLQRKKSAP